MNIDYMIEATLEDIYYIFTVVTHIKTRQRHCIVVASLGKLNGSSDHSAKTSHGSMQFMNVEVRIYVYNLRCI